MRKYLLAILSILVCFDSLAQNGSKMKTDQKNIIKIGVDTYFNEDEFPFSISWETKIAARQSLQFGFLPRLQNDNNNKLNGVGLFAAYRKYISPGREGLQGLYFSPTIKYSTLSDKYTYQNYIFPPVGSGAPTIVEVKNESKVNSISAGFLFGRQWVYKSGFALDISGGVGYFNNTVNNSNNNNSYYYYREGNSSGITPNLNIKIGYAF